MEEYTIVAKTKGKADVWRHFGLRKRKADRTIVEKTAVCLTCNIFCFCLCVDMFLMLLAATFIMKKGI